MYVEHLIAGRIISACKKQFSHTESFHMLDMKKACVDLNGVWGGKREETEASDANDCHAVMFPAYYKEDIFLSL